VKTSGEYQEVKTIRLYRGERFDVEKVISLSIDQMNNYKKEASDNIYRFRRLYQYYMRGRWRLLMVLFLPKGNCFGFLCFFIADHRAYYILVGNHPDGRTVGASHALIDAFISGACGRENVAGF